MSFELSKLFESDFVGADIVPNVTSQRNVGEFVVYTQQVQRLSQMTLEIFTLQQ